MLPGLGGLWALHTGSSALSSPVRQHCQHVYDRDMLTEGSRAMGAMADRAPHAAAKATSGMQPPLYAMLDQVRPSSSKLDLAVILALGALASTSAAHCVLSMGPASGSVRR